MNWINNRKILTKIFFLVALFSVFIGIVGYIGYHGIGSLRERSEEQNVAASEVNTGNKLLQEVISMDSAGNDIAADPQTDNIIANQSDVDKNRNDFEKNLAALNETAVPEQKQLLEKIDLLYKAYLPYNEAIFKSARAIDQKRISEQRQAVVDTMVVSEEPMVALLDSIDAYLSYTLNDEHSISEKVASTYSSSIGGLLATTLISLLLASLMGFAIAIYGISKPTNGMVGILNSLIDGNLDVKIEGTDRKDEIGDVARAALSFREALVKSRDMAEAEKAEQVKKEQRQRKIEQLIQGFDATASLAVSTVASASGQLSQTAESMSDIISNTNQQTAEVASASEEASTNVQSVASAAEQMAATVQEISRQVSLSNGMVKNALDRAETANNSSNELVEMSKSVGAIATMIEDIAGQINLLALNATIESARSGEAGKGFAVVANEVKNLAMQTAKATEQIRQQLEGVQTTASNVASVLGEVREAISTVNESSSAIAAAVEEQSSATREIVSNMNTTTRGVEQINSGIFSIKAGTDTTKSVTQQVLDASRLLSSQAEKMDKEVKSFLHEIQRV